MNTKPYVYRNWTEAIVSLIGVLVLSAVVVGGMWLVVGLFGLSHVFSYVAGCVSTALLLRTM